MHAVIGDEIIVETETIGASRRRGRVLEVRTAGSDERYRVAWEDGHESVLVPGPGIHVVQPRTEQATIDRMAAGRVTRRGDDPVRTIMSSPVAEISGDATLRQVAESLSESDIGALVVTRAATPLGVVSERDVVRILAEGSDPDVVSAADMVAPDTVWAAPNDSIRHVAGLMWEAEVRHIPLRDENAAVGVVSIRDVLDVVFQTWDANPASA